MVSNVTHESRNVEFTAKQLDVLDLLDRRLPIKTVAAELGVSPSAVNQHIAKAKQRANVSSLPDLVRVYRQTSYRNSTGAISGVSENPSLREMPSRDDPGLISLTDAQALDFDAFVHVQEEPRVVPVGLDGRFATIKRLAMMFGLSIGIVVSVVVTIASAQSISQVLEGQPYTHGVNTTSGE